MQFSPNGRFLAAAGNADGVTLWDMAKPSGEPRVLLPHTRSTVAIMFTQDGEHLLAVNSHTGMRKVNIATGESRPVQLPGSLPVYSAVISPQADYLAATIFQLSPGDTSASGLISLRSGSLNAELEVVLPTYSRPGVWFPDGMKLTLGNRIATRRGDGWDFRSLEWAGSRLGGLVAWMAASIDGDRLAGADRMTNGLIVHCLSSGATLTKPPTGPAQLNGAAFHPYGRHLAAVTGNGDLLFFDSETLDERARFHCQLVGLRSVAFSPDGCMVAVGTGGRQVILWDVDF